ncbi:MAG: hypothetical protein PHC53_00940 [Patescibacteria group bacterium]|nr:hypothetical protein [Patescibacteria group bacterium]
MAWQVEQFDQGPITKSEVSRLLSLLPKPFSKNVDSVIYQPTDNFKRRKFAYPERLKSDKTQDGKIIMIIDGPSKEVGDYEQLAYAGRFVPNFLRQIVKNHPSLQDDPDLIIHALTIQPSSEKKTDWQKALAHRLWAQGHGYEQALAHGHSTHEFFQNLDSEYALPQAAWEINQLRRAMIKRLAQQAAKNLIKNAVKDVYVRAALLKAIFDGGVYSDDLAVDQASIPSSLLSQVNSLVQDGDAHQIIALRNLAALLRGV